MITLTVDIRAHPHKSVELLQTLESLMIDLRQENGNLSYQYQQDDEDNNSIHIQAEWGGWDKLENHLQGNFFSVLLGAIRVLGEEPVVKIDDGHKIAGMEMNHKGQKKKP